MGELKEVPALLVTTGDTINTYTGDVDMDEFTLLPHEKQALGYVKLWRCSRSSSVWDSSLLVWRVFTWLLMSVNYKSKTYVLNGKEVEIAPGEIITSYRVMAERVSPKGDNSITPRMVRRAVDRLVTLQILVKIGQGKGQTYLHLKVLHWDTYQATDGATYGASDGQPAVNLRSTTIEGEESKEGKEVVENDPLLTFALMEIPDSESTKDDYRRVIERHRKRLTDSHIERIMSNVAGWNFPPDRKKYHLTLNSWLHKEPEDQQVDTAPPTPGDGYQIVTDIPAGW